eukprot:TRINITY_DN11223_c0_g1_i1.p2 TRINITY_DN11223_c0_g1~~TRINITY_DN11223_c0_g1_i1.p2  ORF type:complete len:136 (+),score=4.97 TRINITY_DN11223_c0_g1_i1:193-600(+)
MHIKTCIQTQKKGVDLERSFSSKLTKNKVWHTVFVNLSGVDLWRYYCRMYIIKEGRISILEFLNITVLMALDTCAIEYFFQRKFSKLYKHYSNKNNISITEKIINQQTKKQQKKQNSYSKKKKNERGTTERIAQK